MAAGAKRRRIKRAVDIAVSGTSLVLLTPILAIVWVLVRWRLGSPALFVQERPGLGGKPFRLIKFRTMRHERDSEGNVLPDADRLPPFGRWLRSTSLDELPELWNVLRGDMSLVGPRPLLVQYLTRYSATQARRHEVKPGMTGWAVVNGRNALSWDERLALDVWYVDHWTVGLDFRILAATIWLTLRRHGVSAPGEATMPEFLGSPSSS